MITAEQLDTLSEAELRQAARALFEQAAAQQQQLRHKQALIDKLTHENATLKRLKFAAKSEGYSAEQRSLIEETLDTDLAELGQELANLGVAPSDEQEDKQKNRAKRQLATAKWSGELPLSCEGLFGSDYCRSRRCSLLPLDNPKRKRTTAD